MSKYTTQLRFLVENNIDIFDFSYDFYDSTKKAQFQQDFINHFYLREIGTETVKTFKLYLKRTFTEKLPRYNALFKLVQLEYDNLFDTNVTETYTKTDNGGNFSTTSGTSHVGGTSTDSSDKVHSDTPQNNVSNIDNYLTDYDKMTGNNTSSSDGTNSQTSSGTANNTQTLSRTLKGNNKFSQAEILEKSIDLQMKLSRLEEQFFNECNDLFMLIY